MENELIEIALSDIILDERLQTREMLNSEAVEDYAARYAEGAEMPAVTLFRDGGTNWLADGFHRVAAARKAGKERILAMARDGSFRDALLFAAGANASHGLRRSNADKRRAVEMLLSDTECAGWSAYQVAEHCGVGRSLVADVRQSGLADSEGCGQPGDLADSGNCESQSIMPNRLDVIAENCELQSISPNRLDTTTIPPTRTVTRNGKTYQMKTGNIGKRPATKPEPSGINADKPAIDPPYNNEGLLPCPFCGNRQAKMTADHKAMTAMAICSNTACNVIGPRGENKDDDYARENWNRRADYTISES
jgi:hypothetical protein